MAIAALRTKQTTTTTGTGTLTLIAAASNVRSFNAALGGSAIKVHYVISVAGSAGYEIGIGTYNGASPGTLTRDTVLASSNGGSAVSLPAGTHDVFVAGFTGRRGYATGSGAVSYALADIGGWYVWTGTANTITLPAVANVPPHIGTVIVNGGTGILTIDGNASETINGTTTIALYPGQSCELLTNGTAWFAAGNFGAPPIYKTSTGTMTAGVLAVTFSVAFPNAILDASAEQSGASGTGTFNGVALSALATTGFTAYSVVGYGGAIRWRAWGY